jgi:hypothetical protein
LPANFHSSSSFKKALSTAKEDLLDHSILESGKIDAPLLLLGLIYREVSRALEAEPGTPTDAPSHLIDSPLGVLELNKVDTLINGLSFDHS